MRRAYHGTSAWLAEKGALLLTKLKGGLPWSSWTQSLSGGPVGKPGQYGGTRSRIIKKSLNPVWKREWIELRVQGGVMNEDGEYDNPSAPWTRLRVEVSDHPTSETTHLLKPLALCLRCDRAVTAL